MSDEYITRDPSRPHGMFRCVLCGTGYMTRKTANRHVSGSGHRNAVHRKKFNGRLEQRAVHVNNKLNSVLGIKSNIELLGLPRWRHHIKAELCDYILTDNGSVDNVPPSVDKLLETYTKYERTSLLELAVWKASCLWFDGSQNFHSMQDILDQWTMDSRFDPTAYKSERRFTGNVAVIMRGVLAYLE